MNRLVVWTMLVAFEFPLLQQTLHAQTQWEPLGPYGGTVTFMKTDGKAWVYAGISGSGIFRSADVGRTWEPVNTGLPGTEVRAFTVAPDGRIFCGGSNLLAVSSDRGTHWKLLPVPSASPWTPDVKNILVLPDSQIIISFEYGNNPMRSTDHGATWKLLTGLPMQGGTVSKVEAGPNNTAVLATLGAGVYLAQPGVEGVSSLTYDLPKAFAGATPYEPSTGCVVRNDGAVMISSGGSVCSFNPQTKHWTKYSGSFRNYELYQGADSLVYGYNFAVIVVSRDFGQTWTTVPVPWEIVDAVFFVKINGSVMLSEGTGFWRSDDDSKTWKTADQGIVRTDISCGLVSSMKSVLIGTLHSGIFRSTDGGVSWNNILFPSPGGSGDEIVAVKKNSQNIIFAASRGRTNSVWRSTTDGASWTQTAFKDSSLGPIAAFIITDLFMDAHDVLSMSGYAVSHDSLSGIFQSTDNGQSWKRLFIVSSTSAARSFMLIGDSLVIMGTYAKGFSRSTDKGSTWTPVSGTSGITQINSILQDSAGILVAATSGSGIMRSTDMGLTWKQSNTGLSELSIRSISKIASGVLFAGTDRGGYISLDHGQTWASATSGGPFTSVGMAFAGDSGTVYVTTNAGLFKATSLRPTGIMPASTAALEEFSLSQNYPNPFNPSTVISFTLPSRSFVTLTIYDVMGRAVAAVLSEELPPGTHACQWNASGFASGVYFYRLHSGTFTETKRLILLR